MKLGALKAIFILFSIIQWLGYLATLICIFIALRDGRYRLWEGFVLTDCFVALLFIPYAMITFTKNRLHYNLTMLGLIFITMFSFAAAFTAGLIISSTPTAYTRNLQSLTDVISNINNNLVTSNDAYYRYKIVTYDYWVCAIQNFVATFINFLLLSLLYLYRDDIVVVKLVPGTNNPVTTSLPNLKVDDHHHHHHHHNDNNENNAMA